MINLYLSTSRLLGKSYYQEIVNMVQTNCATPRRGVVERIKEEESGVTSTRSTQIKNNKSGTRTAVNVLLSRTVNPCSAVKQGLRQGSNAIFCATVDRQRQRPIP